MAMFPFFVMGPNSIVSIIGLFHGPDKRKPVPDADWHDVTVDVVIPAHNEENTIVLCLESLMKQTIKPHKIVLIDDKCTDRTIEFAEAFSKQNKLDLEVIHHKKACGKTVGLKEEAHALDGDVEFILDADTILGSETYLERVVEALYSGHEIATACGVILPLREKDRKEYAERPHLQKFLKKYPDTEIVPERHFFHRFARGITNYYRDFLYFFLQHFVYHGQMVFFGTIVNPVGCAVAYRRDYLRDLFDHYEPILGDDLTTSEDIFIGFAMLDQGYRNVQVRDVYARSEEPEVQSAGSQMFKWSSAFIQSCYYFPELLFSPFKFLRRLPFVKHKEKKGLKEYRDIDKEHENEPYHQPYGIAYTKLFGRAIGWSIFFAMFEKIAFPITIILLAIFQLWVPLLLTMGLETGLLLVVTLFFAKGKRLHYVFKGFVTTPIRYLLLLFEIITLTKFLLDIFIFKDHHWRK